MSEHCPQDGGFIGDAGCTHPNHQHSELVKGIIVSAAPRGRLHLISEAEAEAALKEGFYVDAANGHRIGFGKTLLEHLDDGKHNPKDVKARKEALALAVQTVKYPDKVEWHHEGLQGRTAYVKAFDKRGILAVSDREGKNIEFVFNVIPKRELKKRFAGTAANGNPSTAANCTTTSFGKAIAK